MLLINREKRNLCNRLGRISIHQMLLINTLFLNYLKIMKLYFNTSNVINQLENFKILLIIIIHFNTSNVINQQLNGVFSSLIKTNFNTSNVINQQLFHKIFL